MQAKSKPPRLSLLPAPATSANSADPLARNFIPSELDLDDLAEAIRCLLASNTVPQNTSPGRPNPDLLLVRPRVSHGVVEERQAA